VALQNLSSVSQLHKLWALAFVHFVADMFGNFLPAIIPEMRDIFGMSLAMGTGVLFVFYFTHNGIQVFIGHLRADKSKPLLLMAGAVISGLICFLAVLERFENPYVLILGLAFFAACGVGMMHTEGLRALHALDRIPWTIGTSIFMGGGFLGAAFGQVVSAVFVQEQGLTGLYWLLVFPGAALALILIFRIRLAVETDHRDQSDMHGQEQYRFWRVFTMSLVSASSVFLLLWFVPQRLNELGFDLGFGGFTLMLFTISSAAGSFFWGWAAHKKGQMFCARTAMIINIPLVASYLFFMKYSWAAWILLGSGFCGTGAYVMMVTMARSAIGLKIGQRVGLLVGGTWAVAGAVSLLLSPLGLKTILWFSPVGFAVTLILSYWVTNKQEVIKS